MSLSHAVKEYVQIAIALDREVRNGGSYPGTVQQNKIKAFQRLLAKTEAQLDEACAAVEKGGR
jgi:hypothetical protein